MADSLAMKSAPLSWALARASSPSPTPLVSARTCSAGNARGLGGVFGGGPGVDAERPHVRAIVREGVDGVAKTALLAHLLEQPRGHTAAQHLGEQAEGEIVRIGEACPGSMEDQVRPVPVCAPWDESRLRSAPGAGSLGRGGGRLAAEPALGEGQHLALLHRARGRDDDRVRRIEARAGRPQRRRIRDRATFPSTSAEHGSTERLVREGRALRQFEHQIVGNVRRLGDLLGDDACFSLARSSPPSVGRKTRSETTAIARPKAALQRADLESWCDHGQWRR